MIFFTSDLHFNHANIIKFCDRPFKDVDKMNTALITNINQRCKSEDTLYHIGDFAFRGGHQGGKQAASYFENQLNCKLIHILGNHDKNNHVKNSLRYGEIWFANRRWCLQHKPPMPGQMRVFPVQRDEQVVYLVGHVHTSWKHSWIEDTLVINVGTDMWKYRPSSLSEIAVYADRCNKENNR